MQREGWPTFGFIDLGGVRQSPVLGLDVRRTIDVVRCADELGFERYWIAQHFSDGDQWGDSTPMITLLAAATRRIKVGAGGIMLSVNSTAQVASAYRFLSNVFPDRVELGVARATPEPAMRVQLDADLATDQPFEYRLTRLLELLDSKTLPPCAQARPTVWLLGTGTQSAHLASSLQLNYAHSALFGTTSAITDLPALRKRLAVAYFVMVGDSDADAVARVEQTCSNPHQLVIAGTAGACVAKLDEAAARDRATDVLMCLLGPVVERVPRMRELAAALAWRSKEFTAGATS